MTDPDACAIRAGMTDSPARLVRAMHEAFGHPVRTTPAVPGPQERILLENLIVEEVAELLCAMRGLPDARVLGEAFADVLNIHDEDWNPGPHSTSHPGSVPDVAREAADVVAFIYGVAMAYGFDLDAAMAEVHAANMRKVGDDGKIRRRRDGKVLKPNGWRPPNVAKAIGMAHG